MASFETFSFSHFEGHPQKSLSVFFKCKYFIFPKEKEKKKSLLLQTNANDCDFLSPHFPLVQILNLWVESVLCFFFCVKSNAIFNIHFPIFFFFGSIKNTFKNFSFYFTFDIFLFPFCSCSEFFGEKKRKKNMVFVIRLRDGEGCGQLTMFYTSLEFQLERSFVKRRDLAALTLEAF